MLLNKCELFLKKKKKKKKKSEFTIPSFYPNNEICDYQDFK